MWSPSMSLCASTQEVLGHKCTYCGVQQGFFNIPIILQAFGPLQPCPLISLAFVILGVITFRWSIMANGKLFWCSLTICSRPAIRKPREAATLRTPSDMDLAYTYPGKPIGVWRTSLDLGVPVSSAQLLHGSSICWPELQFMAIYGSHSPL